MKLRPNLGHVLSAAAALLVVLFAGCVPVPLAPPAADMGPVGPVDPLALDPKTLFMTVAKQPLVDACQGCHEKVTQGIQTFLAVGDEYNSIINYKGGSFITKTPEDSLLLTKGAHVGPALTASQYDNVLAWLQVEVANRAGLNQNSPATPSVALGAGDFFISLEKLTGDPLAKLTFSVELRDSNTAARILNLTLTTGPFTGLHLRHPLLLLFSVNGATKDPADSLSGIEFTLPASMSMPVSTVPVLLTRLPTHARLALAFEAIDKVMPDPNKVVKCKDYPDFAANVVPQLGICAGKCHGMGAADPQAPVAQNAFDMTAALGQDMAKLSIFCLQALARANTATPSSSVLVLQATPAPPGTPNHPFKLTDATKLSTFTTALVNWITKEK